MFMLCLLIIIFFVLNHRNTQDLVDLVTRSRTVLSSFAKAKTAKLGTAWIPPQHIKFIPLRLN